MTKLKDGTKVLAYQPQLRPWIFLALFYSKQRGLRGLLSMSSPLFIVYHKDRVARERDRT